MVSKIVSHGPSWVYSFCFAKIIRLDKRFHSALGLYLGDGIKKDMDKAVKGETVLEEMQSLLATTSTNLIG